MKSLSLLNEALDYIEASLTCDLTQADIAAHCCRSLSSLQKLFRYAFHISVGD